MLPSICDFVSLCHWPTLTITQSCWNFLTYIHSFSFISCHQRTFFSVCQSLASHLFWMTLTLFFFVISIIENHFHATLPILTSPAVPLNHSLFTSPPPPFHFFHSISLISTHFLTHFHSSQLTFPLFHSLTYLHSFSLFSLSLSLSPTLTFSHTLYLFHSLSFSLLHSLPLILTLFPTFSLTFSLNLPFSFSAIPLVSDLCGVDVQWFEERSWQALPNSKELSA